MNPRRLITTLLFTLIAACGSADATPPTLADPVASADAGARADDGSSTTTTDASPSTDSPSTPDAGAADTSTQDAVAASDSAPDAPSCAPLYNGNGQLPDTKTECNVDSDCCTGGACVWIQFQGRPNSGYCFTRCTTNNDCAPAVNCKARGWVEPDGGFTSTVICSNL